MYFNCIHLMGLRALQGTGCQQVVNPAAASTHTLFSERKWLVIHLSAERVLHCSAVSRLPTTSSCVCPLPGTNTVQRGRGQGVGDGEGLGRNKITRGLIRPKVKELN